MVRWALEDLGLSYADTGLDSKSGETLMKTLQGGPLPPHAPDDIRPFSPPYLQIDGHLIAHVANILLYLGEKHQGKLAPKDVFGRLMVNSIQLTIADLVTECHDTHHAIDLWAYYEDQKEENMKRAKPFRETRIPKYLGYFSGILGDKDWLVGSHCTCGLSNGTGMQPIARFPEPFRHTDADLSVTQTLSGLLFAFPKSTQKALDSHPNLIKLMDRVKSRPGIKAFLESARHQAFNQTGIYRKYPELDP
jgi:glutathione S-transferase